MNDHEIDVALRKCDGGGLCRATVHIHGCYSDTGDCNYPKTHERNPDVLPQHMTPKETP